MIRLAVTLTPDVAVQTVVLGAPLAVAVAARPATALALDVAPVAVLTVRDDPQQP